MFTRTILRKSAWRLALIFSLMLFGCAKRSSPQAVAEPGAVPSPVEAVAPAPLPAQPAPPAQLPPPKPEEVREAINRVFKTAVVIDRDREPNYLVGDFNGDQSQDLAMILKPAPGKIEELNQEFPSWIAREPLKDILLPKSKALTPVSVRPSTNPSSGQTIRFEPSDVLLAILHGSGEKGWRDPDATQTHLLRDVVGTNISIMPLSVAVKTYRGVKPFPTIYGDLIRQTLIGQSGFLHFTGGIYGWYDPKHFSPGAAPVHARMSRMK